MIVFITGATAGFGLAIARRFVQDGARIIAVCDAFDAMVTERPYSAAREYQEALAELRRCAGTQFDPMVVAAFDAAMTKSEALV